MWQDYAIAFISILFTINLIPQLVASIKGRAKTSFLTAFSTGSCLLALAFIYSTLDLGFSCFLSTVTGLVWFLLWFAGRGVKCVK